MSHCRWDGLRSENAPCGGSITHISNIQIINLLAHSIARSRLALVLQPPLLQLSRGKVPWIERRSVITRCRSLCARQNLCRTCEQAFAYRVPRTCSFGGRRIPGRAIEVPLGYRAWPASIVRAAGFTADSQITILWTGDSRRIQGTCAAPYFRLNLCCAWR